MYGFSSGDDSPDFQLDTNKALTERYLSLPGGVLVSKPVTGASMFNLPNLHGDTTAQVNISSAGAVTVPGAGWVNDPYGQPINTTTGNIDLSATPTTRTGTGTTDSWLGQHQRGYEHANGLNQALMGARTYLPALGIFTATDPIEGGNTTTYGYPTDPSGYSDLSGTCGRTFCYLNEGGSLGAYLSGGDVADAVKAVRGGNYGELVLRASSTFTQPRGSATKLAQNMAKAGMVRPAGTAAHHIVAGNSPKADKARKVLTKFKIDVNSAENGVFLPENSSSPNPHRAAVHSSLHTSSYYDTVNELLGFAHSKADALLALGYIRDALLAGGL